jgi:hypothetical protein
VVSPPLSLFPDWATARLIAIPDPDSLEARIGDYVLIDNSTSALPNIWSLCLVNHLHLFFIHPASSHFDCGE